MKKKEIKLHRMILLFSLALSLIVASACNNGNNDSQSASPSTSPDASASAGSSSQPSDEPVNTGKYEKPIKLTTINTNYDINDTLPAGQTVENNEWTTAYREMLGIEVETLYSAASGGSMVDKMKLLIATDKLPDVYSTSVNDYDDLVKAGRIADLTDAYEKYASPALKALYEADDSRILNMIKRDGKIYGLPLGNGYTESPTMMLIRKDWLEKLGLEAPKTWDELYNVAKKFKESDLDGNGKKDNYGLGTYNTIFAWDASLSGFFNIFHAYPATASGYIHWINKDGTLVPGYKQPEMRTALEKLQQLYKEGIMSKEWMTMDGNKLTEDLTQGKFGVYFGGVWDADYHNKSLKKLNPDADFLVLPLPSVDGTPAKTAVPAPFVYTITVANSKFAHPEAIIKMANLQLELLNGPNAQPDKYFANKDGDKLWKMQVVSIGVDPDNGYTATMTIKDAILSGDTSKLAPTAKIIYDEVMAWEKEGNVDRYGSARVFGPENSSFAVVDHYVKNDLFQINEFHGQFLPVMKIYWNGLWDKANEAITKTIVSGDMGVWDEFLQYWDKQGGLDMEAEVNEWYKKQK